MVDLGALENSYNRKQEKRILACMDLIDDAKIAYYQEKHKFNVECEDIVAELETLILENKAHIKIAHGERKERINQIERDFKLQMADLKENYRLDCSEAKIQHKLVISKVEANYKRVVKDFDAAIAAGDPAAMEKKKKFLEEFESYLATVDAECIQVETAELERLNKVYNEKLAKFQERKEEEIREVNELFLQQSKRDELLKENNNVMNKELKKEFRLLDSSVQTKIERRQEIKRLKAEIKEACRKRDESNHKNKEIVLDKKNHYLQIKKENQTIIKQVRLESKEYVKTLDSKQKQEYREINQLVRQDYRSRRKAKLDDIEKRIFRKVNPAYVYIMPAFFGALFFTILPFIFMLITAFFKLDLTTLSNSEFVGFKNFVNIFTRDTEFQKALYNTVIYAFCTIVLLLVVTIGMAAWLAKNTRIHNLVQTMVFTPHIASLVAISILWIAMLNPSGIINQVLAVFGIEGPGWLVQENTSLLSVSFVTVWKDIGYYVLIIISGLQSIPAYIYEAAKLDKSKKANTFFKLTLPLLVPTLSFVFVTKFISSFKVFAPIEIMTNGGPMGSSMVLSYWIYKVGRVGYNYGQAMAGAIILTIMIAFCTFFNYRFFKKKVTY